MQTLNGMRKWNTADSYAWDVGDYRHALGNWNLTADTGATGAYTLFRVTGSIYIFQIIGICNVSLDSGGAGTVEVGIAGNTASLIAQTLATNVDANYQWQDAAPEANPGITTLLNKSFTLMAGADIIFTIGGFALTAGDIDFSVWWIPQSKDGNCVGL